MEVIGGLELVRVEDAAVVLERIRHAGLLVLGADGFTLEGGAARPDPSSILDLSGLDDPARSVQEAQAFVVAVARPGLLLEIVVDD